MIEVEKKYKLINKQLFYRLVRRSGLRCAGKKVQIDTYYSPFGKTFLGKPEYLRVRENRVNGVSQARLEYHRPFSRYAAREWEVGVTNVKVLKYILQCLGFKPEVTIYKIREEWVGHNIEVELDQVRGLGNFIEIEIMNQSTKQALKRIDTLSTYLGLSKSMEVIGVNYFKMWLRRFRPAVWKKYYS